jgi:hypothetical protein
LGQNHPFYGEKYTWWLSDKFAFEQLSEEERKALYASRKSDGLYESQQQNIRILYQQAGFIK